VRLPGHQKSNNDTPGLHAPAIRQEIANGLHDEQTLIDDTPVNQTPAMLQEGATSLHGDQAADHDISDHQVPAILPERNTEVTELPVDDEPDHRTVAKPGASKPLEQGSKISLDSESEQAPGTGQASQVEKHNQANDGVYDIERVLKKQWSGKVLWLRIKWVDVPNASWEKAEHIRNELGEEGYQELMETLPRKKRKRAAKW
jgi:hypothetical protein